MKIPYIKNFPKIDKESLEKELAYLSKREKLIISLRYGLNNSEAYTKKK